MKKKHVFKTSQGNIIVEHKKPFSRFTALRVLKNNRIILKKL